MKINDVTKQVDLTKRAIKYYEEKGLLHVIKNTNGYRNYTEDNIETLKTISVYRKLGLSLDNIYKLIKKGDYSILNDALHEKEKELGVKNEELKALQHFIESHDIAQAYKEINYNTIANALQDAVPGFTGYYFVRHFLPYLQIKIDTKEQEEAYNAIIEFWDNTKIRMPFVMKIMSWIMYLLMPRPSLEAMVEKMNRATEMYSNPTPEEYAALKQQVQKGVKIKNNPLYRYSPAGFTQRRFMKELQNKGYNDIFIPNMVKLSPKYREYHEALMKVNDRICSDLNLYYDTNFNLIQKKGLTLMYFYSVLWDRVRVILTIHSSNDNA